MPVYVIAGVTDGEYFPLTPSFTASVPFAPEYFGWSNLPPSSEKCRCPSPCFAGLPTFCGAILKLVSLTTTFTVELVVEPFVGLTNATFAPGAPTCLGADVGLADAGGDFFLLLPHPAAPTAVIPTHRSAMVLSLMGCAASLELWSADECARVL